jgi:hypothetical protein
MSLLLTPDALDARRPVARGPLAPLADSLARDLAPLLTTPPDIPAGKALLSRVGGRCETDGTDLLFDPASPHAHRCPRCGRVHTGEFHDRWWLYPYHLWLAERGLHAAVLHALHGDARHAQLATHILDAYASRYLQYPNRDNVLGPSRVFFSTYLESLWTLHICLAADLMRDAGHAALAERVMAEIAEPAVALIEEYDEGLSNRQVWNATASIAARGLLGAGRPDDGVERALTQVELIITHAIGGDGAWYEGDNYHQFAHRGLWYAVALGERMGWTFDGDVLARFEAGFAAPFRTALPDFTQPARKDSRYASSLRQWRFAESCELGMARADDPMLRWALARMYEDDIPPGDSGRARASGEAERPEPAVRLSRADLGWKALLFARESLPADAGAPPSSLTVESQGYTVHRRDGGRAYVALDWGESGGGHGHPDRLNLVIAHDRARWLDDMGTGSYVDPSLHWYRSTLAHNAPLIDGRSQARVNGWCMVNDTSGAFDVIAARADGLAPGVRMDRTIVTGPDHVMDELRWVADRDIRVELPIHVQASPALRFAPATLDGGDGTEDGFSSVSNAESAPLPAGAAAEVHADGFHLSFACGGDATVFRADAPGPPPGETRRFHVIRMHGRSGTIRSVYAWTAAAPDVAFTDGAIRISTGAGTHEHLVTGDEWTIAGDGGETRTIFAREPLGDAPEHADEPLEGAPDMPAFTNPHHVPWGELDAEPSDAWGAPRENAWAVFELDGDHYRRTEETWHDAGCPRARVAVGATDDALVVDVYVETAEPQFVPAGAVNPFDNEPADINGHGVQVYCSTESASGAWMLVPEASSTEVRVRAIPGWGRLPLPTARWRRTADGFAMRAHVACDPGESRLVGLDVIVNDAEAGRTRRRGQLVLSGAHGEFAYLQGDRHDPRRLVPFDVG